MVPNESDTAEQLFQPQLPPRPAEFELIPENYFAPLELEKVFRRPAPLEVDLGCGDGRFLAAMAEQVPGRNFLGIERMFGRVSTGCRRAARQRLENLRILNLETTYAVEYLLPRGSVAVAHLLFPDPWPKKRHKRRRIVQDDFVASIRRMLAPDGRFRIATDQEDYFEAIREIVSAAGFAEEPAEEEGSFPVTTFEKRFLAEGAPIYRLRLRKVD